MSKCGMGRRRGEFSSELKEAARRRAEYRCERCGREGMTEVHHLLGLSIAAKKYPGIAPAILSSLENAMCLCKKCHKIMDRDARKNHKKYAKALIDKVGEQKTFLR